VTEAAASAPTLAAGLGSYLRDIVGRVGLRRVAVAVLLVLLGTLSESIGLLLLVPLLQLVNGEPTAPALRWLTDQGLRPGIGLVLSLFVGTMLLRAWIARLRDMQLLALRLSYVDALRSDLESALARASWEHLVRLQHADVMHLMFDQLGRINLGTHQLMQALSGLGLALASMLVLLTIAPLWTLALVLPLGGLLWLLRHRLALTAAMGSRFGQAQREMLSSARDFLAGLKLVKAHAVEDRHLAELADRAQAMREHQLEFAQHQAHTRGWFEVGGALVLSALLYGATVWGHMDLPELLLMVLVFSRLLPVLRDGQLQAQQLAHMLPAFQQLQAWITRCRAGAEHRPAAPAPRRQLRQSLAFEDLTLRHEDDRPPALTGINLTLKAGTLTVLMGPSGAGKTTLADVALGLLAPTTGAVLVDGMVLASGEARRDWRGSVAYVAQDPYLFPGSIRDNLCWLSGPRGDDEIWEALELSDASQYVRALGDGLAHRLGERGEGLSGGQRQRLALARALLCRPELLVLDEVSSQLDAGSEERVLKALGALRGKVTILAIAHRSAASLHADRTVVLEHGRVVSDSDVVGVTPKAPP
jgi:ATP-binding cassette, subfamily C, bacterial